LVVAGDAMHTPFIDCNDDDNGGRLDKDFRDKDYLAQECVGDQPRGKTFATSICPYGGNNNNNGIGVSVCHNS
jgi:hypothetical protein